MDIFLRHLKFARRAFLKDKFFAVLNMLGLSLGIAIGIILLLVLQNDLTYDQHYKNHQKIYRLGSHYKITGVDEYIGFTARELGPILKQNFPEIEALARIKRMDRQLVETATSDDHRSAGARAK